MLHPIPHERLDLYNTLASKSLTLARRCTTFSTRRLGLVLIVAPQLLLGRAAAVPLSANRLDSRSLLEIRDSNTDVSPKIWVPTSFSPDLSYLT